MNNECRLLNAAGLTVAVGAWDHMMSMLKYHTQDGEYAVVGPGIDARFYRVERVVYPGGGQIDGQTIPTRSRDECVAEFGLAMELNKAPDADRYTLQEWIEKETRSYGYYLNLMSGDELVQEYYRQGGEEIVWFDRHSETIVVNNTGCPKCGGRLIANTEFFVGDCCYDHSCWCPRCGYGCGERMRDGVGAGGEEQLSPEQLVQKRKDREVFVGGPMWRRCKVFRAVIDNKDETPMS